MSQNRWFLEHLGAVLPQIRRCAEMLEFEENICISYRFKPHRCYIFLILRFPLTSESNCPSPELFRGAALFSEYAEILDV